MVYCISSNNSINIVLLFSVNTEISIIPIFHIYRNTDNTYYTTSPQVILRKYYKLTA